MKVLNDYESVHAKVQSLVEYWNENGRPPKMTDEYKGLLIGKFFYSIKKGNVEISAEDREVLKKVGYQI